MPNINQDTEISRENLSGLSLEEATSLAAHPYYKTIEWDFAYQTGKQREALARVPSSRKPVTAADAVVAPAEKEKGPGVQNTLTPRRRKNTTKRRTSSFKQLLRSLCREQVEECAVEDEGENLPSRVETMAKDLKLVVARAAVEYAGKE